jgi:hypothetical protein
MKRQPRPPIALIVALSALLTGCGGAGSGGDNGPITTRRQFGALESTLTVPKRTFARGEYVPMTLTVRNTSNQPLEIVTSGSRYYGDVRQS